MTQYYNPGTTEANKTRSPIRELEDDILPPNPLGVAMNGPVTSIGALVNRLRTKALTSAAAHEVFQDLVVTRLRAQTEVLKLNGELVAAARKKEALNAYMAHGMDLSKKLSERLIETMEVLTSLDWDSFDAAEAEAQAKFSDITQRRATGEMNKDWAERALVRVEYMREAKTAFGNRIVSKFLEQLDQHVTMTLATIQKDSDRYADLI
ncbi:hypothetical protein [Yoonia vestfoldensis]|uniref:hypothetical protein n=1 Tax=Yoonia vestfoldensis TaxID=245188 RepID=UPI00039D6173|nr:hypothetical protein [Yoonia vestfoldensis]